MSEGIWDELKRDFAGMADARDTRGRATYGEPLTADSSNDPLASLEEELLDALAYARQARHLMNRLKAELVSIAACWASRADPVRATELQARLDLMVEGLLNG